MIHYFLFQYNLIQIAEKNRTEKSWLALERMIDYYSTKMQLSETPIPLLGETYYSTGSFQYYKDLMVRLRCPYYLVSVDRIDLPLFWPLVLHELAHCKLGESDFLTRINRSSLGASGDEEYATAVESRIEEALCDIIATRVIGPAYVYAYLVRLWALLPRGVSPDYPIHGFRIECMADILDAIGIPKVGKYIRQIRDEKLPLSWEREIIAPLKDQLIEVTKDVSTINGRETYMEAVILLDRLYKNPKADLTVLFTACWEAFDRESPSNTVEVASSLSSAILSVLERGSEPLDSSA